MVCITKRMGSYACIAIPRSNAVPHPVEPHTARCRRIVGITLELAAPEEQPDGIGTVGRLAQRVLWLHYHDPCARCFRDEEAG